jgi:hypothetical protein
VIRSNVGSESVEKWGDVKNEPISGDFWKKAGGIPLGSFFNHRYIFLRLKTAFSRHFTKSDTQ